MRHVLVALAGWGCAGPPPPLLLEAPHVDQDFEAPRLQVATRTLSVRQGHTLPIVVAASEPLARISAEVLGKERQLYPVDGVFRALVGVAIRQEPGPLALEIVAVDEAGNHAAATVVVDVEDVDWLWGGTLVLKHRDTEPEAITRMRRERDAAYTTVIDDQHWAGPMRFPTTGRITSPFGVYRTYPTGGRSHHDAIDVGNQPGTPIFAANAGEVLVAQRQAVLGNAVIVHHGQGVTTSYNHMLRIDVAVGDRVEQGQQVGLMGATGNVTGPHLHWGMVVDGIAVDAQQWVDEGFEAADFAELVPL